MATLVKIRGLDRGDTNANSGTAMSSGGRGFRVPSALGYTYPSGSKAFEIVGTVGAPNAAVTYTSRYAGALGENLKVIQNAPSGSTRIIATTYATTTGYPTVTITPTSTDTAATLVTAVNADNEASQYVVASLPGTGASAPVASADASAVLALSAASGTVTVGTFTLTFPGYGTTTVLNFNDSAATMAAAIQVAIRLNANHAAATVTGGGTALPTGPATMTFGAAGGANTPFPVPTFNWVTGPTGGTYGAAYTTWGRAAAGTLAGGLNVGTNAAVLTAGGIVGTGQVIYRPVHSKAIVVVDVDDPQTQRVLKRNATRYVSLGQP